MRRTYRRTGVARIMRRVGRVLLATTLVALVVVAAFLYWSVLSPTAPESVATRDTTDAVPSATDDATPTPAKIASAEPPPKTPSATSVRVARPTRVMIPAIGVDAKLKAVGLNDDGSMEVPDFGLAGWYDPGPRPGEPGPAVIVAHVDSYKGPDVFFRLRELSPGDEIKVRHRDGTSSRFVVRSSEQQLKEELPADRIWNETRRPVLRLVTCGGDFDRTERSYRSNVIVFAAPAA